MTKQRLEVRERVVQYRARMQSKGLRQINLWVPDTRSAEFAKECRRQSRLAAKSDRRDGILDALDKVAKDIQGWTA